MKVDLLPPDAPEWQSFLQDAPHDFYHLPSYAEMSAEAEGGEAQAILVEDGARRMLLPVVLRSAGDGARDASSPYGYPGPLVAGGDNGFAREAFAAASRELASRKVVALFVRGHPLLGPDLPPEVGTVIDHGPTVSIDLTRPEDELWRVMSSGHKAQIKKALRAGHRAFFDERFEHLDVFMALYRATMDRVGAEPHYFFADRYFADLRQALGERLHLCLVEIGGEIAGGGLFVETGGLVQFHLSGTVDRFRRERPSKLMLHFVRGWAKERGSRRFHLGGGLGAAEDSLFEFKAGFATDRHEFRTLRVVTDEPAYADLVHARDPGADATDLRGYFPLYRK